MKLRCYLEGIREMLRIPKGKKIFCKGLPLFPAETIQLRVDETTQKIINTMQKTPMKELVAF